MLLLSPSWNIRHFCLFLTHSKSTVGLGDCPGSWLPHVDSTYYTFYLIVLSLPRWSRQWRQNEENHTPPHTALSKASHTNGQPYTMLPVLRGGENQEHGKKALFICHSPHGLGSHAEMQKGRHLVNRRFSEMSIRLGVRQWEFEALVNHVLSLWHYGSCLASLRISLFVNGMGGHCFPQLYKVIVAVNSN